MRLYRYLILKVTLIFFLSISLISGCSSGGSNGSSDESEDEVESMEFPQKYVAIGASLTAGVQSSGIVKGFQLNSFPYLIAMQLGIEDFEQPIVNEPGIGFTDIGLSPLQYDNGEIFAEELFINPLNLLGNVFLDRPYDNLGLPGAELIDVQSTSDLLFQIVLRGMGTQLEQAISLNPDLVSIWIGINDVLSAATKGGRIGDITSGEDFEDNFRDIIEQLADNLDAIIMVANIPNITDIPFVNFFDNIFRTIPELGFTEPVPVIFDENFEPLDFGDGLYIPLLLEEENVVNLLLNSLDDIREDGEGLPGENDLISMGLSEEQANDIITQIEDMGFIPTGEKIGDNKTLTLFEDSEIESAVLEFNSIIDDIAGEFNNIRIADVNSSLFELKNSRIDGFSGKFVLIDNENTAFSLDGIHPNNAGYAIIANIFIELLNKEFGFEIPLLETSQFQGQYQ